jgi:TraB/PrgY/gumN family
MKGIVAVLGLLLGQYLHAAQPVLQKLDELDEVVVEGRVPGPPLWKISKGDHELWILPLIDIYPKNIEWDSTHVEKLMAGSQEYLYKPRNGVDVVSTPGSLFSIFDSLSAYNKVKHLPRGRKLSDILPPDLYKRLLVLKSRYFPLQQVNGLTVWEARRVLQEQALDHERLAMVNYSELTSPRVITTKLLKWLNKANLDRRTYTSYFETVRIASAEMKRASKAMQKMPVSSDVMQWEIACLEKTVAFFEKDFAGAKRRANAWAQGRADDLLSPTRLYTQSDPCRSAPLDLAVKGNSGLEQFVKDNPGLAPDYAELDRKRREKWLAEAERALDSNTRTFGVLTVNDILDPDSLVATLESRGYKVEVFAAR